jgi:hypothetical protein
VVAVKCDEKKVEIIYLLSLSCSMHVPFFGHFDLFSTKYYTLIPAFVPQWVKCLNANGGLVDVWCVVSVACVQCIHQSSWPQTVGDIIF